MPPQLRPLFLLKRSRPIGRAGSLCSTSEVVTAPEPAMRSTIVSVHDCLKVVRAHGNPA